MKRIFEIVTKYYLIKMWWLLVLCLIIPLGWYYLVRPLNYWKRKGVPQTNPWIIFGDLWTVIFQKKSFAEFSSWIYNMFPVKRYCGFYQFNTPYLMIRDPELIKQISIKDFDHFTDHGFFSDEKIDPVWSRSLFSLKGQAWKDMRISLTGAFTSAKMKIIFSLICETAESFTRYFDSQNEEFFEIDARDVLSRFTSDAIASAAIGIKVDSLRDPKNEVYAMGRRASDFTSFSKSLRFLLPPKIMQLLKMKIFEDPEVNFFSNIVFDNIKTREEQKIFRPDMINVLLEARKGAGEVDEIEELDDSTLGQKNKSKKYKPKLAISDFDIAVQAFGFFFGGLDTVSITMTYAMYELAVNVDVQEKLRLEIMETMETCDQKVTYDALMSMKYMDMFTSELLRKWSAGTHVDRVCTKPYTIHPLNPDEVPVELEVGDYIALPYLAISSDSKYWPEPEKFIPERFSDENKRSINPYTYLPFGVGPRNCIGSRYALLAIKTFLFHLLPKYEVVSTQKTQIPLKLKKGSFIHIPETIWLGLRKIVF